MEQRGSITVFFSCIFLCMVLVVVTMIDGTFLYMGRTQSERAVNSASYALLAEYYQPLKDEFGLFAYDKEKLSQVKALSYVESQLKPYETIEADEDFIDEHWTLYDYEIANVQATASDPLLRTEVTEQQILEYMKYRAPLDAIEPFLQKLEMLQKVAKTSKLAKEKSNKVDKKVGKLNKSYQKLMGYVEGIDEGKINNDYFVKTLLTSKFKVYSTRIPDQNIVSKLSVKTKKQGDLIHFSRTLYPLFDRVSEIQRMKDLIAEAQAQKKTYEDWVKPIEDLYDDIEEAKEDINENDQRIDDLQGDISDLEGKTDEEGNAVDNSNKISSIEKKINRLEDHNENLYDDILSYEKDIDVKKKELVEQHGLTYDQIKGKIEDLTIALGNYYREKESIDDYIANNYGSTLNYGGVKEKYPVVLNYYDILMGEYSIYYQALKKNNASAVDEINAIAEKSKEIKENINNINKDIQTNQDEYDKRTAESIQESMEEAKVKLYDTESGQTDKKSLARMKEILKENVKVVDPLLSELNSYPSNLSSYIISNAVLYDDTANKEKLKSKFNQLVQKAENVDETYSTDMQFDFGEMKSRDDDVAAEINEQVDQAEDTDIVASQYVELSEETIQGLPSKIEDLETIDHAGMLRVDDEADFTDKIFDSLSKFNFGELLENIRNEVYINEYILDKFTDFVEYNESGSRSDNFTALNHEVEYVLGGQMKDYTNTKIVEAEIMLIRCGMNFLHIMVDTDKKMAARALAAAIAGWWTLGVGTFVLELVIIGAWSIAESYVDILQLKSGDEVAFYKSDADWYLGIHQLLTFTIDKVADAATEVAVNVIDKAGDKITETSNDFLQKIGDAGEEQVSELVSEATETISGQGKKAVDNVDYQIDDLIKKTTEKVMNSKDDTDMELPDNEYLDDELVKEIQGAILEKKDELRDKQYEALDKVSEHVLEKVQGKVGEQKEIIIGKANSKIEEIVNVAKSKATDATKEAIDKAANSAKEKAKDLTKELDVDISKKKTSIVNAFQFSYEDYLRLLLMIQSIGTESKQKKIHRVQDLIQMRIKASLDENFVFEDYHTKIDVSGQVYRQYLFIDKLADIIDDNLIEYNVLGSSQY